MALTITGQATDEEHGTSLDKTRLVAALSNVERLRWELDAATFELRVAVEEAILGGASPADIASVIDLGPDEVQLLVSQ